jgi:hypothetical protein
MIRVADHDSGIDGFRSLGFTITPPRRHIDMSALQGAASDAATTNGKATINQRHIIFRPYPGRDDVANFLELMCIEDQLNTPPSVTQMLSFLLDTVGPKTVVCYSNDLERSRAAMLRQGIETAAPIPFETGWEDSERGRFVRIWARPAVPVFGQTPFQVNPFETNTLADGYHYEPWTVHPNGAKYLAGVTGVTNSIAEHAEFMAERVFGSEVQWVTKDEAVIRPRDVFFRILTPRGFAARYPGLDFSKERILPALCGATIAVESMERLRRILNAGGIEYVGLDEGGVAVGRQIAANTLIEFVPAVSEQRSEQRSR